MSMTVDVRTVGFDISPFEAGGELGPEIRARIMEILALKVIQMILVRVYKGETPEGSPFQPYSPGYDKWKRSKGRSPGSEGDWLRYSGQMLAAIKPLYFDGDRFLVGFDSGRGDGKSNALIAWVHDTEGCGKRHRSTWKKIKQFVTGDQTGKGVRRPFFYLSEEEKEIAWTENLNQARQEGLI